MPSSASLAAIILGHLHQRYPYKPGHVFEAGETSADPSVLSPVFSGSFDWHSSVHSHWALVRLRATGFESEAIDAALKRSFSPANVAAECAQLEKPHRRGFELPYGMAWLLTLGAEALGTGSHSSALEPLIEIAATRFAAWVRALPCAIRSGEHSQSAFAMSLALDAAHAMGREELAAEIAVRARDFYEADRDAPIAWEPSAWDFLSPALAEADLMSRVLGDDFPAWLEGFLPRIDLVPVASADRDDGKLAHADGLNLSRAWMLARLSETRPELTALAQSHLQAGLASLEVASYAGTHWLPSFAVYALHGAR